MRTQLPKGELCSCIPCLAIVCECATERSGRDRAAVVANHATGAARRGSHCTFWCSSARVESTRMRIVRRHGSAAHHGILRANGDIRCAAIRSRQIVCPICRRSSGTAGKRGAYELCTEVGSASLYCTNSKRGGRRPGWRGSIRPDRQREPQAPPADDNTGQGEYEPKRTEPDDQDVAQTRMCD